MDSYSVRYGESFDFSFETDDVTATVVTFYVGKEGQEPIIVAPAVITNGIAFVSVSRNETKKPLGTYKYQLTVEYDDPDKAHKFPSNEYCEEYGLPEFTITEALDETEVVVS